VFTQVTSKPVRRCCTSPQSTLDSQVPASRNTELPGADPGGPPPLFLAKSVLFFYTVHNVWKNIFEIEFWFYSDRNPRSFWKCGGCMRLCLCDPIGLHDKSVVFLSNIGVFRIYGRYCFLFYKGPFLNDIRGHYWFQLIYARLQEIASNFSKFSGGGP